MNNTTKITLIGKPSIRAEGLLPRTRTLWWLFEVWSPECERLRDFRIHLRGHLRAPPSKQLYRETSRKDLDGVWSGRLERSIRLALNRTTHSVSFFHRF